jgi:hypothetical protein
MKITSTFLSIPPYLSTPWDNVSAIQASPKAHEFNVLVTLKSGTRVEIPHLSQTEVNAIFEAHARFIQQVDTQKPFPVPFTFSLPLNGEEPITSLGAAMQHNPEQANLPNLPPQLLEKIIAIAKSLGIDDSATLPAPVDNCNCVYCQLAQSFGPVPIEEPITIEELTFRDWEISQTDTNLYNVVNPLDKNEHYNVFLGTPIGCTCGSKDCEHIKAVLKS